MEAHATLRHLRMSPKKVRLVIDLIRGLDVADAKDQLRFLNKAAARVVRKLLDSAIANATNNFFLKEDNLFVKSISADGGPTLKRWRPRAFGRASQILRRTTHIHLILAERVPTNLERAKKMNALVEKLQKPLEAQKAPERPVEPHEFKKDAPRRPSDDQKHSVKEKSQRIFNIARVAKRRENIQHQDKKG